MDRPLDYEEMFLHASEKRNTFPMSINMVWGIWFEKDYIFLTLVSFYIKTKVKVLLHFSACNTYDVIFEIIWILNSAVGSLACQILPLCHGQDSNYTYLFRQTKYIIRKHVMAFFRMSQRQLETSIYVCVSSDLINACNIQMLLFIELVYRYTIYKIIWFNDSLHQKKNRYTQLKVRASKVGKLGLHVCPFIEQFVVSSWSMQ